MSDVAHDHGRALHLARLMGVEPALTLTLAAAGEAASGADAHRLTSLRAAWNSEKDAFLDAVARLYASVYAPQEIDALIDFLTSPAGEAMRRAQPVIEQGMRSLTTTFLERAARSVT